MKVCIVSKIDSKEVIYLAQSVGWMLDSFGHEVVYDESIASELGYCGVSLKKLEADLVLVIGGDGSVLRAVRLLGHQIPVIGINSGFVGFLTDVEQDHIEEKLKNLALPFKIEERMRVSVECNGRSLGCALNEAVIVTSRPAKFLQFEVYIDGKLTGMFRADGLILSTPTGSTAYAMSAGGPIVDSAMEAVLVVPLAPYMLSSRPYVINPDSVIEVKLSSVKPALLVIDGQNQFEIGENACITIRKAAEPARFVDVGRGFFDKVEQKLRQ
ncbi:MAG TPA: NAD(+)/NADH kinase [Methanocorpusculum sp.]|nr:NAD(+)/NADH kinase [Methanocorpusculum sp.]